MRCQLILCCPVAVSILGSARPNSHHAWPRRAFEAENARRRANAGAHSVNMPTPEVNIAAGTPHRELTTPDSKIPTEPITMFVDDKSPKIDPL